jgi:hypothetical protein
MDEGFETPKALAAPSKCRTINAPSIRDSALNANDFDAGRGQRFHILVAELVVGNHLVDSGWRHDQRQAATAEFC